LPRGRSVAATALSARLTVLADQLARAGKRPKKGGRPE
jgi:hypothetical protein